MKGYKAFKEGLICKDKQYKENTVFEEEKAEPCRCGMHFCKDPLDVLNYYPLVDEDGNISEFAEVEALDECKTDDDVKFCTTKLKIGAKIEFPQLVQAAVGFEIEKQPAETKTKASSRNNAQISSIGHYAQVGSSGDGAQIGSSGYNAQIGSSGDYARIGSSGNDAQIGSSGDGSRIGSSGHYAKIGSSGDYARIGSSGNDAQIGSSGYNAQIGSSGNYAQVGSSGDYAQVGSCGDYARIGSSGDLARIGSSGNDARIVSRGQDSVICCAGRGSVVKAKIGSWITLAEWKYDNEKRCDVPVCVKTVKVDGETIKEDTFYKLINGEFVEAEV